MRKFNIMLSEAHINRAWLTKLLSDCESELNRGKSTPYEVGAFLDRVFGLEFYAHSRIELGKFIKSGAYKQQLELYKNLNNS